MGARCVCAISSRSCVKASRRSPGISPTSAAPESCPLAERGSGCTTVSSGPPNRAHSLFSKLPWSLSAAMARCNQTLLVSPKHAASLVLSLPCAARRRPRALQFKLSDPGSCREVEITALVNFFPSAKRIGNRKVRRIQLLTFPVCLDLKMLIAE